MVQKICWITLHNKLTRSSCLISLKNKNLVSPTKCIVQSFASRWNAQFNSSIVTERKEMKTLRDMLRVCQEDKINHDFKEMV